MGSIKLSLGYELVTVHFSGKSSCKSSSDRSLCGWLVADDVRHCNRPLEILVQIPSTHPVPVRGSHQSIGDISCFDCLSTSKTRESKKARCCLQANGLAQLSSLVLLYPQHLVHDQRSLQSNGYPPCCCTRLDSRKLGMKQETMCSEKLLATTAGTR